MDQITLLYRQVNPDWIREGRPTSQAFSPFPKDEGKLSVYNGDKWTAQDSFDHFTETQGFAADGNVAVTVGECDATQLDTVEDNNPYDGHAYIDYTPYTKGQIKSKAKKLKKAAIERDWTYRKNI